MLPVTMRPMFLIVGTCLILLQALSVTSPVHAALQIHVRYGPSLNNEGTPFEEPESDETPKAPHFGDGRDPDPQLESAEDASRFLEDKLLSKWLPLLSWYARIRF